MHTISKNMADRRRENMQIVELAIFNDMIKGVNNYEYDIFKYNYG